MLSFSGPGNIPLLCNVQSPVSSFPFASTTAGHLDIYVQVYPYPPISQEKSQVLSPGMKYSCVPTDPNKHLHLLKFQEMSDI